MVVNESGREVCCSPVGPGGGVAEGTASGNFLHGAPRYSAILHMRGERCPTSKQAVELESAALDCWRTMGTSAGVNPTAEQVEFAFRVAGDSTIPLLVSVKHASFGSCLKATARVQAGKMAAGECIGTMLFYKPEDEVVKDAFVVTLNGRVVFPETRGEASR